MTTPRSRSFRILALILTLALLSACAPSITREMLTPSPTAMPTARPTRTPDPNATTTPSPEVKGQSNHESNVPSTQPVMTVIGDLVMESYLVGDANGFDLQPGSFDQNQKFYENIPQEIFHNNQALWAQSLPPGLDQVNETLQGFGHRLEKTGSLDAPTYLLYHGEEILSNRVTGFGPVEVNASGTNFIQPITLDNYEVWLLQKDRFELWFAGEPRFFPVFAGDDQVAIGEPGEITSAGESKLAAPILVNGKTVFQLDLPYQGANKCPIENFRAWGNHWVVEREGEVIVDAESLTEKYGYQQVFDWQALGGSPFFLFEDQDGFGIHYDGDPLPLRYDEIVHWGCVDQQSGSGYDFSAHGNDNIAGFFARKAGKWYYIEVRPIGTSS